MLWHPWNRLSELLTCSPWSVCWRSTGPDTANALGPIFHGSSQWTSFSDSILSRSRCRDDKFQSQTASFSFSILDQKVSVYDGHRNLNLLRTSSLLVVYACKCSMILGLVVATVHLHSKVSLPSQLNQPVCQGQIWSGLVTEVALERTFEWIDVNIQIRLSNFSS